MLLVLLLPVITFIVLRAINWIRNYLSARAYGLPIVLIPVSFQDVWWMPIRPLFSWVQNLPLGLGNWYLYTNMGWPIEDGNRSIVKYGENFVLCSPKDNIIVTAEALVVEQVFTTRSHRPDGIEWRMPDAQSQMFTFYGQNVSSTHGEPWKRHRKITASAFNERTMEHVWDDAVTRTSQLQLDSADGNDDLSLATVREHFNVLAMRILTTVGFGQETTLTEPTVGHRMSLMDSLGAIMQNILLTVLFHSLKAPSILLPSTLRQLKLSVEEFRLYMQESVHQHFQLATTKPEGASGHPTSLLEAIIRANEEGKNEGKKWFLSDSELYGNIFVFNLAGYETTASTFTFALSYLAAYPEVQEWVRQEVDAHFSSSVALIPSSDAEKDEQQSNAYAETYPKLVRCLAIMHETLRLATHAPMFVRSPTAPVSLEITPPNSSVPASILVKPGTLVGFNNFGAHLSPKWGSQVESFEPTRFILTNSTKGESEEHIVVPENTLYLPFMAGPRVCPGKKFSQVEFVAVLASVLSKWTVEAASVTEESKQQGRARLLKTLDDKYFNVSAHLRKPETAALRFVRR